MTHDSVVVCHVIAYTLCGVYSAKPIALLMSFTRLSFAQPPSPSTSMPKTGPATTKNLEPRALQQRATLQAIGSSRAIHRSLRKVRRRPGAGTRRRRNARCARLVLNIPKTLTVCALLCTKDTRISQKFDKIYLAACYIVRLGGLLNKLPECHRLRHFISWCA